MTESCRLRVGVIGCGSIGLRHAQNLITLGHIPVIQDTQDQRLDVVARHLTGYVEHERPGKFYHLDAAMICTPVSTHAAVAEELLTAGYHGPLFVEKALATSLDVCDVFQAWPHSVGQVGYNLRFHAGLIAIKKRIEIVGPVSTATFTIQCDKSSWPGQSYEDVLLECSHEIDSALDIFGPATCVGAAMTRECWTLLLQHRSGSASTVVLDGTYAGYRRRVEICGPKGVLTLTLDAMRDGHWSLTGPGGNEYGFQYGFQTPDETYQAELTHFLECVAEHKQTVCPIADGLAVLQIMDQARTHVYVAGAWSE